MGPLAFLADEHVDRAYVVGVRANGYDVAIVGEDYPTGEDDETLISVCEDRGLVILTNDRDFVRIGRGGGHPGIVIYSSQAIPVSAFVGAIRRIDDQFSRDTMRDQILWLTQWV